MSSKRIFVFGLDGASWRIIDSFVKKGYLPFFKKLISQGVRDNLISSIPPRTAPAWASFITGRNPGDHGVFDFVVKKDVFGKEKEQLVSGRWLKGNQFWKRWEKEGKRVALINLPMTYPVERINGVVISSLLTPKGKRWFYPPDLADLLEEVGYKREGFDFLERLCQTQVSSREVFGLIKKMAEARFQLGQRLLREEDWDFFFLLFSETDWIQHWFWRGQQTIRIYQAIDYYLETFYQILRKKYGARGFYFFLISDHGFHPAPKVYFNLYPWLRRKGFLRPSSKAFWGRVLRKISFWERDKSRSRYNHWGRSSLVRVDNFGLWLNRKRLGKRYQSYREELIKELKKVKYANGKKVFKEVFKREEVFSGRKTKRAWDIVLLTNPYFFVGSTSIERKIFVPRTVGLKGIHDSDRKGIFLAKGVGIKNYLKEWQGREIYIWQMSRIFQKIFGYQPEEGNHSGKEGEDDLDQTVIDRLKALGYI